MRLTTKPGVSLQRIGSLPSRSASSNAVSTASGDGELRADDLHQREHRGRVEEVHADDPLRPPGPPRHVGYRERRGVRGEHRVLPDDGLERAEELLLGVELLDDRLDDEVAFGEVGELGGRRQARERGVPLLGRQPAFLDAAAEVVGDPVAGAPAELLAHLAADRLDPRLHADLGDPGTHGAETDHSHPAHVGSAHSATVIVTWKRSGASGQPSSPAHAGSPSAEIVAEPGRTAWTSHSENPGSWR